MQIEFIGLKNSRIKDVDPVEENVSSKYSFGEMFVGMAQYQQTHKNLAFCAVDKYGLGVGRIGFHDEVA